MSKSGTKTEDRADRVIVVMPAYNAARTLEKTFRSIPEELRERVILVDDHSRDQTVAVARKLGIASIIEHDRNRGYGANQKTCYREALRQRATIVVMVHPDNQYDARLIPAFVQFIKAGTCDIILGNRIRTRQDALSGGMPKYKYLANRILTLIANCCLGTNLGDFHSGFRVYSRNVLENVAWEDNADDFSFDPEFLAKAVFLGYRVGDAPIPCSYPADASSIGFRSSVVYGMQLLIVLGRHLLARLAQCSQNRRRHGALASHSRQKP